MSEKGALTLAARDKYIPAFFFLMSKFSRPKKELYIDAPDEVNPITEKFSHIEEQTSARVAASVKELFRISEVAAIFLGSHPKGNPEGSLKIIIMLYPGTHPGAGGKSRSPLERQIREAFKNEATLLPSPEEDPVLS